MSTSISGCVARILPPSLVSLVSPGYRTRLAIPTPLTSSASTSQTSGIFFSGDSYAPYASPGKSPFINAFSDPALPLVSNASPLQRTGLYEDEYEEAKSFRSNDFEYCSCLTSNRDDSRRSASCLNAHHPVIAVSVTLRW